MDDIEVNAFLTIPAAEVQLSAVRSPGSGGQSVNKLNTRVELRYDVASSVTLTNTQRDHLLATLYPHMSTAGDLVICSSRYRSQQQNRKDCVEKFITLVAEALRPPPPPRRNTKPRRNAVERRLKHKKRHGLKKNLRRRPPPD